MTSKTSICNAALSLIGADPINSFDDSSKNARRCAMIYDQARKALLRMHPWNCAVKREVLSPIYKKPAFGEANTFPLPPDFVRMIECNVRGYSIENRHLLCNALSVHIRFVFDNNNEQTWDDLLVEAMSLYMASKLAKPITGSSTEAGERWQELQLLLKQARAINGQEYPSQQLDAGYEYELTGVRY